MWVNAFIVQKCSETIFFPLLMYQVTNLLIWHIKRATVNGGNGKWKRKRKAEKGNGRHSNTYTVQAINARIGARAASLGVHHWVGVKPGLWTQGLMN